MQAPGLFRPPVSDFSLWSPRESGTLELLLQRQLLGSPVGLLLCLFSLIYQWALWKPAHVLRPSPVKMRRVFVCEISEPAWERVPHDKLLYSFHRLLSCPILGTGITFEETSIRYTAFVYFFLFFSFFFLNYFPLLSVFHTHKIPHRKEFQTKEEFGHHAGLPPVCVRNLWFYPGQSPVGQGTVILTKVHLGIDQIEIRCVVQSSCWLPQGARAKGGPHTGQISRPPLY